MLLRETERLGGVKGFHDDAGASHADQRHVEPKRRRVIERGGGKVDEEKIVERLSGRFSCTECGIGYHDKFSPPLNDGICDKCNSSNFTRRSDDNPATVRARLSAYKDQTAPILPYYSKKGYLKNVNGMADMDAVFDGIKEIIDADI